MLFHNSEHVALLGICHKKSEHQTSDNRVTVYINRQWEVCSVAMLKLVEIL